MILLEIVGDLFDYDWHKADAICITTNGFVKADGSSGVEYQIRRKEHIIYAWKDGKKIASLCVYLQDTSIPPTDEVVAKMLICECDEKDIWKRANVTWWTQERLIMVA